MNYKSPLCSCIICHETKSVKGIFSHFITKHTDEGNKRCKKNGLIGKEKSDLTKLSKKQSKVDLYKSNPLLCNSCNEPLSYAKRKNKYCGHKCAAIITNKERIDNGYVVSKNTKLLISLKNKRPPFSKIGQCKVCNKFFHLLKNRKTCSDICYKKANIISGQKGGKVSNTKRIKRSKDEIKLFNLCKEYIDSSTRSNYILVDNWDVDIFIPSLNLAIMWNGPWHYKEMKLYNHSLLKVQERDNIKINLFRNAGFVVKVFEDRYYTPETALQEIKSLVAPVGIEPTLTYVPPYQDGA